MSETIFGRWYAVQDEPIPTDPDVWIVTARKEHGMGSDGEVRTYTYIRAHLPGAFYAPTPPGHPSTIQPDAWLRIPPPPWLEGK